MRSSLRKLLTGYGLACVIVFAISNSILGLNLPVVMAEYGVSLSEAGVVSLCQNIGGILALLFCGYLSDRFGKLRVISALFIALTSGLLLTLAIRRFAGYAALGFVIGFTASGLNMAVCAYFSDLYRERRAFFVNLSGAFFAAGSLAGPLYMMAMTALGSGWRIEYATLGALGAAILAVVGFRLLAARSTAAAERVETEPSRVDWRALLHPRLAFYALLAFCYMAFNSAFVAWAPTWMRSSAGFGETAANTAMTIFWVATLAGQTTFTSLSMKVDGLKYLFFGAAVGGIALLLVPGLPYAVCCALFFVAGALTSGEFQVCISLACRDFPRQSGTASSVVCVSASCGATVCCALVPRLAEAAGFNAGFRLIGAFLCAVSVLVALLSPKIAKLPLPEA